MDFDAEVRALRFAVTTPWGVELEENIVLILHDDFLVILGDDHLDVTLLLLGDRLGLDARLKLAVDKVLDECSDILLGELLLLIKGELLVLDCLLDGEGGPLAVLQVEVLRVGAEIFGVDGGEVDLTLMFLGKGFQGLGELGAFLLGFCEDVGEWEFSLAHVSIAVSCELMWKEAYGHVASVCLWADLSNQWSCGILGELGDLRLVKFAVEDIFTLIESLV